MIDAATAQWGAAGVYAVASVVLAVVVARYLDQYRRYAWLLVGYVALASLDLGLQATGMAIVQTDGGEVIVTSFVLDMLGYPLLYGGAAVVAGASRRLVGVLMTVVYTQRILFTAGNAAPDGTLLSTVGGFGILVGWPIVAYLFLRPIWRAAQSVSERQKLLHWKMRNLLLFSSGMLVVAAFLFLSDLVATQFSNQLLIQYANLLFRVGVPAVAVAQLTALPSATRFDTRTWRWLTASTDT